MYKMILSFLLGGLLLSVPSLAFGQTPTCTIIYGGGEIDCTNQTATPRPKADQPVAETGIKTTPTTPPKPNPPQTKGGLPIFDAQTATTTPATGPETFALMSLIPMAAAGFWLRKRAK